MTHQGKNDWWMILAVAAGIAASLSAGLYWVGGPALVVLMLCIYPQTYRMGADAVEIRAGLVKRSIPYEEISFVGPCSGGVSLALALDGVSIQYDSGLEVRISPADPMAFMADLAKHTPHLSRRGQDCSVLFA